MVHLCVCLYPGDTRIATKLSNAGYTSPSLEEDRRYFYHSDHLGSAQLVTNYRGEQYEHIEYTPYGELWVEVTALFDELTTGTCRAWAGCSIR